MKAIQEDPKHNLQDYYKQYALPFLYPLAFILFGCCCPLCSLSFFRTFVLRFCFLGTAHEVGDEGESAFFASTWL